MIPSCQAGHLRHDTQVVDTAHGEMLVYDYPKYAGFAGYCEGQDDVSRTLLNAGVWEPAETAEIRRVLEAGDRGVFVDVGAHIGWYSKLALGLRYTVQAFEADAENIDLLRCNAPRVDVRQVWIDETTEPLPPTDIELVKIDIEGNEAHAISMLWPSLQAGLVRHIHMEVSPCFNDTYPALIARLEGVGFTATENGVPFGHDYGFEQTNLLLSRK